LAIQKDSRSLLFFTGILAHQQTFSHINNYAVSKERNGGRAKKPDLRISIKHFPVGDYRIELLLPGLDTSFPEHR
jgi:hypothetical protein